MMETPGALLASLAAVLLLGLAAAFAWYHLAPWTPFTAALGASPEWTPAGGKPASALRFRNCTYTVVRGDGASRTQDVTANLNAMAVGLRGTAAPSLGLHSPLSGFSFVIPGFNDAEATAGASGPWCSGADAAGGCIVRPAASASLAGEYRTL